VVVGDAIRVRTADDARAGVHAELFVLVGNIATDLVVTTVRGVKTGGGGRASVNHVVGIVSFESGCAETLSGVADGVGSALGLAAKVFPAFLFRGATLERIAHISEPALAIIPSLGIDTLCICAANRIQTFVYIKALVKRNSFVAFLADALGLAGRHGAVRAAAALEAGTGQGQ
jgi:hypothetical protein